MRRKDLGPALADLESRLPHTQPPCPHFPACGGCALQHLTYEATLNIKVETVRRLFQQAGVQAAVADPIPAAELWYYRNRMDFVVAPGPVIGLRASGQWHTVVDLHDCRLLSPEANAVLDAFRAFLCEKNLEPYDLRRHAGLVRYIVIREGKNTGRRLAVIVTRIREFPFDELRLPHCTALAHSINPELSDVSFGQIVQFRGEPLTERVGAHTFRISPNAFFQTNTRMAEELVRLVRERTGAGDTLLDLYCGVGLFGISLHDRFAKIIGVETGPETVQDARANAAANNVLNFQVIEAPVEKELPKLRAETAVIDPPRSGMHPRAVRALAASPVRTLVYVSCNPKTMARDLAQLQGTFRVQGPVQPLDLFPWTTQIEAIAKLERK